VSAKSWVLPAFPKSLRAEAVEVADALPHAPLGPAGQFDVDVSGERLTIPDRIYQAGLPDQYESWSETPQLVADCLYTRHHDGRVRERHARLIVENLSPWVIPFVVHLVGEYVLEIVLAINARLTDVSTAGSAQQQAYGAFAAANPKFLLLTRARVVSYWDCYYRRQVPSLVDYPPHRLITAIAKAGDASADANAGNA
jgi:hypothetical protein